MLIKLTPAASTPTILFALAFPDLPPTIPVPAAWVAQLTRLSADDLEAPPSLHALDRAAALPSLLQEVLFDLPSRRISCTFLDGAAEDWELDKRCAEMLARVIGDVEESGRAEERSREWAEAERVRAEIERPAPVDVKDKVEEPSLPVKGGKTKGGLHRSRSLLHALVATFSSRPQMSASAPTARSSFARRASFSALSTAARADKDKARTSCPHPRPVSPSPPQNLQSPAPASGSTFAAQQKRSSTLSQTKALSPGPSPRTLRRRARSTLVDTFRLHVLPVLSARVGLFERAASGSSAAASVGEGLQRAPGGGYHAWVARSMLRRAEARMRELEGAWPALAQRVRSPRSAESSGVSPTWPPDEPAFGLPSPTWPTSPGATFEPWSSDSESDSEDEQGAEDDTDYDPYSDDGPETPGGDGESVSTDSDGSSVHTPESGHSIPYGASLPGNRGQEGQAHPAESLASTTSSYFTCEAELSAATASYKTASEHATHAATPAQRLARREAKRARRAARTEHEAFGRMTARLRGLLTQGAAARELAGMQCEEGERVREVRAARRGWLDGNYKKAAGMARVQVRVFRPSGLRGAWGPGDVSELEEVADEEGGQGASHGREHGDSPPAYEDVVAQGFPPANGTLRVGGHPMSRGLHRKRSISRMLVHHHLELELDVVDLELGAAGLDIDSVGVGLEHLEIDVDAMGLDIDDLEGEAEFRSVDVFAGVSNKAGRSRAAGRVPVNVGGKGRREVWEQRRVVAV